MEKQEIVRMVWRIDEVLEKLGDEMTNTESRKEAEEIFKLIEDNSEHLTASTLSNLWDNLITWGKVKW